MKRLIGVIVCLSIFFAGFADAGIVEQAKEDMGSFMGGTNISRIAVLDRDPQDPYLLRFAIEFDRLVKKEKVEAFWSAEEPMDMKNIREGIDIYVLDDIGYIYLITIDSALFRELPSGFHTPVDVIVGCINPISGELNSKTIYIRVNHAIPREEWHNYTDGVPLIISIPSGADESQKMLDGKTISIKKKKK
jgi:hypothetical protein